MVKDNEEREMGRIDVNNAPYCLSLYSLIMYIKLKKIGSQKMKEGKLNESQLLLCFHFHMRMTSE